jgi:hypothetical protein
LERPSTVFRYGSCRCADFVLRAVPRATKWYGDCINPIESKLPDETREVLARAGRPMSVLASTSAILPIRACPVESMCIGKRNVEMHESTRSKSRKEKRRGIAPSRESLRNRYFGRELDDNVHVVTRAQDQHEWGTEVHSGLRFSPANDLLVAQYRGASTCETVWCASGQVWQLRLADLRASSWSADKRREFLYAPCLQG